MRERCGEEFKKKKEENCNQDKTVQEEEELMPETGVIKGMEGLCA